VALLERQFGSRHPLADDQLQARASAAPPSSPSGSRRGTQWARSPTTTGGLLEIEEAIKCELPLEAAWSAAPRSS